MGTEPFSPGEAVFALNPKYRDGTRLRRGPAGEAEFNGVWVPNDTPLEVLAVGAEFAEVRKPDGQTGWIRTRNLTRTERVAGIAKGVVSTEVVTPDPEYVRGIRIYNLGIKEDPFPGQKLGKGAQHLTSPHWQRAMAEFVGSHLPELRAFAGHARAAAANHPGYDYVYFTNTANTLLERAIARGLRTRESVDLFLMATWLVMAAAEVDAFPFSKYTPEERAAQREAFYALYAEPPAGPGAVSVPRDAAAVLGRFAAPTARHDLLPPVALERLGINNELSALKYADPWGPLRDGFPLSSRLASLTRHFEAVHRRQADEDHVIHLLWNFHAIYHVLVVFPGKNDLIDYAALEPATEAARPRYEPTTSLERILRRDLPPGAVLKLDWNEGALPPPPSVVEALRRTLDASGGDLLKWYPQLGGGQELRDALAGYCGVIPENLLVTNGSDAALILLCRDLLGPGKRVLAPVPTYEHFCVDAEGTGAELIRWTPDDPFAPTADALASAIEHERPDLVYLVSPANPTGSEWREDDVRGLVARFPDTRFLVDEAYHEFATLDPATATPRTCARLATESPQVFVTRTFSKAFCLASVRCGYLIAHPNAIERLRSLYNPKSVNLFAQVAATAALAEVDRIYRPYAAATHAERDRFVADLTARGVAVRSGGAGNFVCLQVPGGRCADLARLLEADGIFVRDISGRFPGYVRITIGVDMTRVADAIVAALAALDG